MNDKERTIMGYNQVFHYQIPTKITFGPGTIEGLGGIAEPYGRRALVVTMKDIPCVDQVTETLRNAGVTPVVFDRVEPNPTVTTVESAAAVSKSEKCDVVIGLGGGSSIDTAKVAALLTTHEGSAWDYTVEMGSAMRAVDKQVPPIIAIPTTSGTGAEVTQNAIVTNEATNQKSPIRSVRICPSVAIVDPGLTVSMPRSVTAATGFDAFTHAFEKFMGQLSFPFVDVVAFDAMKTVVRHLERVLDRPEDIAERAAMAWASTQGGLSVLAESWESGLHVFALPISALFGVAHGETLAVAMPFVMRELSRIRSERVALLSELFPEGTKISAAERPSFVIEQIDSWLKKIGLSRRLSEYGVTESDLSRLAHSTNLVRLSAAWERDVTEDEVAQYYKENL